MSYCILNSPKEQWALAPFFILVVHQSVYNVGEVANVVATANEGFQFVSWTDEGGIEVSSQGVFEYTMPAADVTLTANFQLIDYIVSVAVNPAGAGTINGAGTYNIGDEVVLTATANEGYQFVNWTDSESTILSEDAEYIFTMPAADVNLSAVFKLETSVPDINELNIILYPNPASTNLNISSESFISEIQLLNITGKVVLNESVNNKEHTLFLYGLSSGIYIVKIVTETGIFSRKVQIAE